MKVDDFRNRKKRGEKISMITCYDSWSAEIIAASSIDCVLVGDSLAMTMHGYDSTIPATPELMALHVAAVRRGAPEAFIVGDMPFLSHRRSRVHTMETVDKLMRAGANAIKLEGCRGCEEIVSYIVDSGIPVMGHIGLTPQSIHQMGGYRVQGKDDMQAASLFNDARTLEKLGCFAVVLECVPVALAERISSALSIPTIGIGAGVCCDGQVLVLQDLLGVNSRFKPKFVRTFLDGAALIQKALQEYDAGVKECSFPTDAESYL